LNADIGETKDLAKERAELVRTLAAKFEQWHTAVSVERVLPLQRTK
jgi:hypothetical protein